MTADRKTGLIDLQLGDTPVQLQINFGKIAELERTTGKGIYVYADELYSKPMSVTETARLFSLLSTTKKTETEWGELLWANRKTFDWISFVLDFCEITFDMDVRNPPATTDQEKKDPDPIASTGDGSSVTPTQSASVPPSSGP